MKSLVTFVLMSLVFTASMAMIVCAAQAQALSPKATPAPAPVPTLSPLAKVIEGAKKEGTVSVKLAVSVREATVKRLENEIKAKYGVALKINNTPLTGMPKHISSLLMEIKSGAPPSVDLMTINQNVIARYIQGGGGQKVDWKPLAAEFGVPTGAIMGMPPELDLFYGYGLIYFSAHMGLIYNPKVVPPNEVPKKLSDLADPKWKGMLGTRSYTAWFPRLSYYVGEDYTLNSLRGIVKNGVILDLTANIINRFKLGEIAMAYTVSEFLTNARGSGPAEWQSLDISHVDYFYNSLTNGAVHPNAAKLVALYLASPDGYKLMAGTTGAGNILYPGNTEYEIDRADKAQGLPFDGPIADENLWKFLSGSEFGEIAHKVDQIFKGF